MKMELILMAALALPIQAQEATQPSKVLTAMGTDIAPATAVTPAARAKALPCLAKLPKDTGDFIVLTESATPLLQPLIPEESPFILPASAAVATSEKNVPLYGAIGKLVVMYRFCNDVKLVLTGELAKDGDSPVAKERMKKLATALDKEAAEVAKAIVGKKLHPVYVVTSFKEAPVDMPQPEDGMTLADFLQDVKAVVEACSATHPGMDVLMAEAAKHPFVVKNAGEGSTRIIYICEKGAEPKLATKPEDSMLATPKMARTDAGMGGKMLAAGYASPELQTTLGKAYLLHASLSQQASAAIMAIVEVKNETLRGLGDKTLKSFEATQRWCKAFIGPDAKKPASLQVWTDKQQGVYHVSLDMDARGCSYSAGGSLLQTTAADAKNTFLYFETTPFQRAQKLPDIGTLLKPFTEGVMMGYDAAGKAAADDDEAGATAVDGGSEAFGVTAMLAGFVPMVDDLSSIGKGLGDGFAIIGDFASKSKDKKTPFPRIGYACRVKDMTEVSLGWKGLLTHAKPFMGEVEITTKEGKNGETCHRLKLPTNEGDFVPNSLTDGKRLAIGSSLKLNKTLLAGMASKGVPFSGTVFMLNLDTLRKGLKAASKDPESPIPSADDIPGGVKSIFGSSTISGGVHSIRLHINVK